MKVGRLKPGQSYGKSGPALKSYWAKKTPLERSREMTRRRRVAEAKKLGKTPVRVAAPPQRIAARGFWKAETAKLLQAGSRPRREIATALKMRAGIKVSDNAITVAIASMKRSGMLSEADGMLTLKQAAVTA